MQATHPMEELINGVSQNPEPPLRVLQILTEEEKHLLLHTFNDTKAEFPHDKTLAQLFEEQAEKTPDNIALIFEEKELTYKELNAAANQVAHCLSDRFDIQPDDVIALQLERSEWMLVTILGVFKSGAAYLPIATDAPKSRVEFMLRDSAAKALLTDESTLPAAQNLQEILPVLAIERLKSERTDNPAVINGSQDLAYIIYTSGSTGLPKGVMIEHRGAVNMCLCQIQRFDLCPADQVLFFAAYTFDASVSELGMALLSGATLVVASQTDVHAPDRLMRLFESRRISIATLPPAYLTSLDKEQLQQLRLLITAGEKPVLEQVQSLCQHLRYVNAYGPTECSVCVSTFEVPKNWEQPFVPIGKPIFNTEVHILDAALQLVPLGTAGELCVSGAGLARGYLNSPELTAEKFIEHPFPEYSGQRLYRTGDLARWLPDGNIEFLGRIDHQLKIRGYRIEAGEIEQTLMSHPAIQNAVVVADKSEGAEELTAYFVAEFSKLGNTELAEAQAAHVATWQDVWESTRTDEDEASDPAFDLDGWRESYTRSEIPPAEMKEWVDNTVRRILALQPAAVLEIGVGTGLLLARIAPSTSRYFGIDIMDDVAAHLARLQAWHPELAHAQVSRQAAHDLSRIPADTFDTLVVNSVTQYFPDQTYLEQVLTQAAGLLRSGGKIYAGDIRSLPLLSAFHASVQLFLASDEMPRLEFGKAVHDALAAEKDMAIDPLFFYFLAEKLGGWASIELKNNTCLNEMTCFRYDVSIHLGEAAQTVLPDWQDWSEAGWSVERLKQWLTQDGQGILGLKNIPNSRLYREMKALEWLNGESQPGTVGDFIENLSEGEGFDPNLFWQLAENSPYFLQVNWSAATQTGAFDVAFVPRREMKHGLHLVFPLETEAKKRVRTPVFTNQPIKNNLKGQLLEQIKTLLQERLPPYMMPQYFVALDAMPLTPSGKIDRKALPKPRTQPASNQEYVAPRNPVEATLARLWAEVLKTGQVGIHDNFFHLGGHSLRAIRLLSLVKQHFPVELKLTEVFARPTLAAMAQRVAELAHLHPIVLRPIPKVGEQENYPMSNAQRRLWVLAQMGGEALAAYNVPAAMRLRGELDKAALEQAFRLLFERHEILRTRFVSHEGEGRQLVDSPEANGFDLPVRDCRQSSEQEIAGLAQAHANRVFDLQNERLLQVELLQTGEQEHLLLFNMHHIISDGWSMNILSEELSKLYKACAGALIPHPSSLIPHLLPVLPIQYKDYAAWQNVLLEEEATIGALRNYWKRQLVELPTLDLATDFPRPALKTYHGASIQKQFSEKLSQQLQVLSQANGATLFMGLAALVNTLLYRYTRQTDLVVGTPSAGRQHPDLHDQIGFYVNTLVLRSQVVGTESFEQLLQQVKTTALAAFEHELYPFDRLVEELELPRDMSRSAVFDVMLVLQNNERAELRLGDLDIQFESSEIGISKFDLTFEFAQNPATGELALYLEYNTDLFRQDSMERLTAHLETLLESILTQPAQPLDRLEILPEAERRLLLHDFNQTETDYPPEADKALAQLFEEQVEKTPDNVALIFEEKELTYRELNEAANRLAHCLRDNLDVQPDDVIALQLERSEWMLVAILGVLKSGAAYLPIAPDAPKARVEFMLRDSAAKALLTDESTLPAAQNLQEMLPVLAIERLKSERTDTPAIINGSQDLAYIIYTSGSTGLPKGVMIEHRGAVNMSLYQIKQFDLCPADRVLLFMAYTFDASVSELWTALLSGVTLVLASETDVHAPNRLMSLLESQRISMATLPAAYLTSLDKEKLQRLRLLITGGEKPVLEQVQSLCQHLRYVNAYGPTECSVCVSTFEVPKNWDEPFVPIGKPIFNTELHILDAARQLVPLGTAGELCVSGAGLARGYLNNPELTAQKFIEHPFKPGERLYRTGDLARWLPDGNIEFLGRLDHQLKIRGYRIEAGEIEQAILAHPAVQSCVVVGLDFESGKELVAYLVAKSGENLPDISALRSFLSATLPDYMLPAHFVELPELPLTSSGKVNRKALPAPDASTFASGTAYVAPRNATEHQLADIWQQVLGRENVPISIGIHDNFFHLGGHSLRVIRMVELIRKQLSVELNINEAYSHPTITGLAEIIYREQNIGMLEKMAFTPEIESEIMEEIIL